VKGRGDKENLELGVQKMKKVQGVDAVFGIKTCKKEEADGTASGGTDLTFFLIFFAHTGGTVLSKDVSAISLYCMRGS
jgi:hypothetical protein